MPTFAYKCFLNHRNTDGIQSQPLFMSLWNLWKKGKCLLVLLLFILLFIFQYEVGNFDKLEFLPTSLLFLVKECVWRKRFLLGFGQEESRVRIYNRGVGIAFSFLMLPMPLDLKTKVPWSKHHDLSHVC